MYLFVDTVDSVDFSRQIRPLLAENCFACHGPDENHQEADLRLDLEAAAKESVISPGNAAQSELIARITSNDESVVMPPPESGKSLTSDQIDLLKRWIDEGATWSKHWAFETIVRPEVPEVAVPGWVRNEVDHFVLAKIVAAGLAPAAESDRRAFIRRVSFDLIGLPPTREELQRFLADQSDSAYENLVDRLLDSPHYGEQMAIQWLDGARYADTNGYQNDFYRIQWLWRDWVIQAFNDNMPYEQFVIEQVAGDLLTDPNQSQLVATGFNRNNRTVTENGSLEDEWFVENAVDRVETTSTVFLGLTMGCARCHAHKYDPISQQEFYRFFAFFNNVDEQGVYVENRGNAGSQVDILSDENRAQLDEFDREIARLQQEMKAAKEREEDPTELFLQIMNVQMRKGEYERDFIPATMVMKDREEYRPTYLLQRGQYDAPDKSEELWPAVPEFLPPLSEQAPKNRLGLAQWLVARENPLTSRVIVNRLWNKFFGRGIVQTLDNMGSQSSPPSHPELLDWLAAELMDNGWNLKQLQKKIVLSATYRQSSSVPSEVRRTDLENVFLARASRVRLPAESIRDNALAVSGLLSRRIGGPPVRPYQPPGLWQELAGGANDGPYTMDVGEGLYRRSLYTYRKRTVPHPTLTIFDTPTWETCSVHRITTNTPLQALALLNDPTYVEAGRKFAERILLEAKGKPQQRIAWAYELVTCREIGDQRLDVLTAAYDRYHEHFKKSPDDAAAYLSNGLSATEADLPPVDVAAYALVAATLLNLDEAITRE